MANKNRKKLSSIIISLMILSACEIKVPVIQNSSPQPNKVENTVITPVTSNSNNTSVKIPQSSSVQDEEIIKKVLEGNSEYFPENIGQDDSLEATVPNNGGVVFATVPNNGGVVFATVPNNGGVVFMGDPESTNTFGTKALIGKPLIKTIKENLKNKIKDTVSTIVKNTQEKPNKEYRITFNSDKTEAEVTVVTNKIKEVSVNRILNPLKQNFKEQTISKAKLIKEDGTWRLSQVAPAVSKLDNKQSKIKIESLKLIINSSVDGVNSKTTELDLEGFKNKSRLISISKDDLITIEAKISNGDLNQDNPLEVYTRFSGSKARIPMYDDGSSENIIENNDKQVSGDAIKNDDVYTVNVLLNNKKGINHIIIDVRNPLSNNAKNIDSFNYISKSIPILIM